MRLGVSRHGRRVEQVEAVLRALFATPKGLQLLWTVPVDGQVPSIVELIAGRARGPEAKQRKHTACSFEGHSPMRPVLAHPADLDAWTVPVAGHDAYEVAVGPIHAGVIESGHFRFHVVGESILHVDLRLFYKHRGLERAAEGRTSLRGLATRSAPAAPARSATAWPMPTRWSRCWVCGPSRSLPVPARCCSNWSVSTTT